MARRLIVEIVGDASALDRSFKHASRSTNAFNRDLKNAGRGSLIATAGFVGLRRAMLSTSASFLGGVGVVAALKSTVDAAVRAQEVLAQTKQAVVDSGLSWQRYGQRIQEAAKATSQLSGFDDERLLATFSTLVRRTGDVNKALELNALAANVARGRHIELEQASLLVLKASLGQAGALRRVGIAASKSATAVQLLDLLQRKFAGSARAYGQTAAGAQDRFRVAVENTQEALGSALLPALTKTLNKAADWLNNTKNQKKLQDGLNVSIQKTTAVLGGVRQAIELDIAAWKEWDEITSHLPGGPGGFLQTLTKGSLFAQLRDFHDRVKKVDDAFGGHGGLLQILGLVNKKAADTTSIFAGLGKTIRTAISGIKDVIPAATKSLETSALETQHGGGAFPTITGRQGAAALTRGQRTAVALAGARGNRAVIAAAHARLAFLRDTIAFAQKLIGQHRGNTAQLASTLQTLFGERDSVESILAGIQADADAKAKKIRDAREAKQKKETAAAKAALRRFNRLVLEQVDAHKKAEQALLKATLERLRSIPALGRARAGFEIPGQAAAFRAGLPGLRQRQQFIALGLTGQGEELAPTRKALQAGLRAIEKGLGGTILDSNKNRNLVRRIRGVLKGEFGALTRETRLKIKELEDALKGDKKTGAPLTPFHALDVSSITRGLSRSQALTVQQRLSAAHIVVDNHIHLDGHQIARSVTSHQVRRNQREPTQTRGRQTR